MAPLSLTTISLIVITLLAIHFFTNKFRYGITLIPGPFLASYTRLYRFWHVARGKAHLNDIRLHEKYGPLVRVGPNIVSVSDPAMVPMIYNAKGDFVKTEFYPIQTVVFRKKMLHNPFSMTDDGMHRRHLRKIAHQYSTESLLRLEDGMDRCTGLFLLRLGDFADAGKLVDLGSWLQYYAFDVVGELTFAKKLGFLEQGKDVDSIMATISGILKYSSTVGQIPELHKLLLGNPLLPMLYPSAEQFNEILNFTLRALKDRTRTTGTDEIELEEGVKGDDMLTRWAAVKTSDLLKMSTADIISSTTANVFAGSDTTAAALRSIIYQLVKSPSKMRTLVQEIDNADRAGKLSSPIKHKEALSGLPYLNAVLKEGMRMHPSIGLMLERYVPTGGAVICGTHIPAGTIVGINAWVLHYDREVFPEPHAFVPERWLHSGDGADEEKLARLEKSFLTFGAGSRTCLGRNISLIEMRKIVPELLRRFEMSIPGDKEWKVDNRWFVLQDMPKCELKRRKTGGNSKTI